MTGDRAVQYVIDSIDPVVYRSAAEKPAGDEVLQSALRSPVRPTVQE